LDELIKFVGIVAYQSFDFVSFVDQEESWDLLDTETLSELLAIVNIEFH
jgi:hypothetical protein